LENVEAAGEIRRLWFEKPARKYNRILFRHENWNDLSFVPAVNAKMRIGCQDTRA
jgi:hypothetical protein